MLCLVGRSASLRLHGLLLLSVEFTSSSSSEGISDKASAISFSVSLRLWVQCCCQDGNFEKLRWPKPSYMHVGYIFESRFSEGTI